MSKIYLQVQIQAVLQRQMSLRVRHETSQHEVLIQETLIHEVLIQETLVQEIHHNQNQSLYMVFEKATQVTNKLLQHFLKQENVKIVILLIEMPMIVHREIFQ